MKTSFFKKLILLFVLLMMEYSLFAKDVGEYEWKLLQISTNIKIYSAEISSGNDTYVILKIENENHFAVKLSWELQLINFDSVIEIPKEFSVVLNPLQSIDGINHDFEELIINPMHFLSTFESSQAKLEVKNILIEKL